MSGRSRRGGTFGPTSDASRPLGSSVETDGEEDGQLPDSKHTEGGGRVGVHLKHHEEGRVQDEEKQPQHNPQPGPFHDTTVSETPASAQG